MGKVLKIYGGFGVFLGALILLSPVAAAAPQFARTLPSEVKRIPIAKKRPALKRAPTPLPKTLAKRSNNSNLPKPVRVIPSGAPSDPTTSRYRTRSVFFWHSPSRLPPDFLCDDGIAETKKREAEQEALAKCEAHGTESCRVTEVEIVKNGPLACDDIPASGHCKRSHHYAGCVAVAVVLGEKI